MNLVLQLSTETEARLREAAAHEGTSPESLAMSALEDRLATSAADHTTIPLQQWLEKLHAAAQRTPAGDPQADFSRESIYEGRGE